MIKKYKELLARFRQSGERDPLTHEQKLAIVVDGGTELKRLTPAQIKSICEDRIGILESFTEGHSVGADDDRKKDANEELKVLRKRFADADAQVSNQPATSPARSSRPLSGSTFAENTLRSRISELEAEVSGLRGQLSASQDDAATLRARIVTLENGADLKAAKEEAARCRKASEISDRNVSLLEGFCQMKGMHVNQAVVALTEKSLRPRTKSRTGKAIIRTIIKDGRPVPVEEQLLEPQQI